MGPTDSNAMFLKRALDKLMSDKDIKKRQYQPLKLACESALGPSFFFFLSIGIRLFRSSSLDHQRFSKPTVHQCNTLPSLRTRLQVGPFPHGRHLTRLPSGNQGTNIDVVDDNRSPLVKKLLLHGHLFGKIVDPTDPEKFLIDRIVSIVCNCFHGVQTEERVELQIIKICLTIMVSHTIDIDQRSVLQIVKTCFNIYLSTRSKINEATAQGCLSQILQVIFSKIEQRTVRIARLVPSASFSFRIRTAMNPKQ